MSDPYEMAIRKLRADRTPLNRLQRSTRVPYSTLRDMKRKKTRSPRLDTLKKLAAHYGTLAA